MVSVLTLRPIQPDDLPFVCQVYASTRQEELAGVDWPDDQKAAFLEMQFRAQHQYYQAHYPGATFDLILQDERHIGRLYVARWQDEIRIMDDQLSRLRVVDLCRTTRS